MGSIRRTAQPPWRVIQMDNRHSGRSFFSYIIDFKNWNKTEQHQNFVRAHLWFWQTFGPSSEIVYWTSIHTSNRELFDQTLSDVWSWQTSYNQCRIYVKSDDHLSPWLLTFG